MKEDNKRRAKDDEMEAEEENNTDIFEDFLGVNVKATYMDFEQLKVARGRLVQIDDFHVKITGPLGTIIIHRNDLKKMSESKPKRGRQ